MHIPVIDDAAWTSPWRRRPVGTKMALSLALVLTALVGPVWPTVPLVALTSLALLLGPARIRASALARVLAAPLLFIASGAVTVAVGLGAPPTSTTVLWRWGLVSVSRESLTQSVGLLGHGIAGTLALMVLATTTPMVDLVTWARRCRVPDPLLEVASLVYRLCWVLLATVEAMHEAQQARLGGCAPLRRRLRTTGETIGQVMVRSWDHARRLEDGMAGRGYEDSLTTLAVEPARTRPFTAAVTVLLAVLWALLWLVTRG
ncbi:cobalt ECF transporter T component CbiQ [Luteococcus sp.]|uniref:cobalt ECF transporter T component CbiQ n=1 Tax=Luteococcus sp. TaxID=1969402 RepID=UPI0037362F0A